MVFLPCSSNRSVTSNEFTWKFDPELWRLMLTSVWDPRTAVPEFRLFSGMSARPTEVCGAFPSTDHTSAAVLKATQVQRRTVVSSVASRQAQTPQELLHRGYLAKSEIDRAVGRDCIELCDDRASVIRRWSGPSAKRTRTDFPPTPVTASTSRLLALLAATTPDGRQTAFDEHSG